MSAVRIGIIGLGLMGRVHARNMRDLGGEIVAGADLAAEARAQFHQEFGASTFEDYEEMVADADIDASVICTPNRYHEPAAVAALEAGHSVFVEKPLAHSLEAAERIADATDRTTAFCMVGFHSRFSPAAQVARAYRDDGRFGELQHVEASFVRRRGVPSPGSWFTNADLAGGGSLIDIGGHVIDLALFILDHPRIDEVTAVARSNFGSRSTYVDPDGFAATWAPGSDAFDVDDSVSAFLRFDTGQTIALEVAWATNRPPANELLVRGTSAGARFDLEGDTVTMYEASDLGVDHYRTTEVDTRGGRDGHIVEAERFLEAVDSGVPPSMNTVEEGLTVQRVIDAIYRSNEADRAVRVERHLAGHVE